MAEYIERESLKKVLIRYLNAPHVQMGHSVGQGMRIAIKSCIELLDNEYAADVAPVRHGRWQGSSGDTCPVCGEECFDWSNMRAFLYPYCPYCGTKMDGGASDGTESL